MLQQPSWVAIVKTLTSKAVPITGIALIVAGVVATTAAPPERMGTALIGASSGFSLLFAYLFFRFGLPQIAKSSRGVSTVIVLIVLSGLLAFQLQQLVSVLLATANKRSSLRPTGVYQILNPDGDMRGQLNQIFHELGPDPSDEAEERFIEAWNEISQSDKNTAGQYHVAETELKVSARDGPTIPETIRQGTILKSAGSDGRTFELATGQIVVLAASADSKNEVVMKSPGIPDFCTAVQILAKNAPSDFVSILGAAPPPPQDSMEADLDNLLKANRKRITVVLPGFDYCESMDNNTVGGKLIGRTARCWRKFDDEESAKKQLPRYQRMLNNCTEIKRPNAGGETEWVVDSGAFTVIESTGNILMFVRKYERPPIGCQGDSYVDIVPDEYEVSFSLIYEEQIQTSVDSSGRQLRRRLPRRRVPKSEIPDAQFCIEDECYEFGTILEGEPKVSLRFAKGDVLKVINKRTGALWTSRCAGETTDLIWKHWAMTFIVSFKN